MKYSRIKSQSTESLTILGKGLRGMKNYGNTCYANAILQVLLHTPIIVELFQTFKIPTLIHLKKDSLTIQFMILLNSMWKQNNGGVTFISPKEFLTKFQSLTKTFDVLEQQDSQEFFSFLYRIMHEELTINIHQNNEHYLYNVLDNIFIGELQYRIVCNECSHSSLSEQSFMELSLTLRNNDTPTKLTYNPLVNVSKNIYNLFKFLFNLSYYDKTTLKECIDRYFGIEYLTHNYQYFCPNCDRYVDATKYCNISRLPNIVVFHLSRFTFTLRQCFKLNNQVSFSFENLSLSKYVTEDYDTNLHGSTDYKLYAILCHSGTINYGHYYVYLCIDNKGWYLFNDKKVSKVNDIYKITLAHPYLLFYKRINIRGNQIIRQFNNINNNLTRNIFVPNHWITKLNYGTKITPIDNRMYTCIHEKMNPIIYNLKRHIFTRIDSNQWDIINKIYPSGPLLTIDDECLHCRGVYNKLQNEKNKFYYLNDSSNILERVNLYKINSVHCNCGNGFSKLNNLKHSIDVCWYEKWLQYVDFMNGSFQSLCNLWRKYNYCTEKIIINQQAWEFLNDIYSLPLDTD